VKIKLSDKMEIKCSTCGINVLTEENFVRFPCPNCGKVEIIRCERCRVRKVRYKCEKCGFEGP